MADHVWLKNPETGGVWACPVDYADVAKARGWEPTDAPSDETSPDVSAPEVPAKPVKKSSTTKTGD